MKFSMTRFRAMKPIGTSLIVLPLVMTLPPEPKRWKLRRGKRRIFPAQMRPVVLGKVMAVGSKNEDIRRGEHVLFNAWWWGYAQWDDRLCIVAGKTCARIDFDDVIAVVQPERARSSERVTLATLPPR